MYCVKAHFRNITALQGHLIHFAWYAANVLQARQINFQNINNVIADLKHICIL